ncbi:MAG: putative metallopeptidase [Proteobacteria bacterium]|nr:putative metallopeptidase [Pseudomonadota bacterium]
MGLRYEEVNEEVMSVLKEVKSEYFPELKNAKIKVLFDIKKRKVGGMVILARIMKTNDLLRHLTIDEADAMEGYDYIITLDKTCWDSVIRDDKIRIVRHELRHACFDIESEDNPYKLQDHSISDFYEEVEYNNDDPRWRERLATVVEDIYEQKKEARQDSKKKKERG